MLAEPTAPQWLDGQTHIPYHPRCIQAADTLICLSMLAECHPKLVQSHLSGSWRAGTPQTVNCNIASPGIAAPVPNHSVPAL